MYKVERAAYHGSSNHHKGHRPILWSIIHADGPLVLCEHVGKGGVDGNGVNGVQPSRYVSDADQGGFSQEVEPVIVLHQQKAPSDAFTIRACDACLLCQNVE